MTIWPYFGSETQVVVNRVKRKKPKVLLVHGKEYKVNSWRDVLEKTMNTIVELVDEDKFQELLEEYPRFVNWNNQKFKAHRKLNNGVFLAINFSSKDIKSFCLKAIERVGLSSEDWQVET